MAYFLHNSYTDCSPLWASITIIIFCSEENTRLALRRMSLMKFAVVCLGFFPCHFFMMINGNTILNLILFCPLYAEVLQCKNIL